MADFVAVIRKAVDGLANNTPENRAKVYEKARSAVVRQLESMKPRPPEELLRRQVVKLDTAIAEVESEYAEALPPLEEDEEYSSPAVAAVAVPYVDEPVSPEPYQNHSEEDEEPAQPSEVYEKDYADEHQTEAETELVQEYEREPEVAAVSHEPVEPEVPSYPAYAQEEVSPEPIDEPDLVEPEQVAPAVHWSATAAPSAEDEWQRTEDDAKYPEDDRHYVFAHPGAPQDGPLPVVEPVVAEDPYRAPEPYNQEVSYGEGYKTSDAFDRETTEPKFSENVFDETPPAKDRKPSAPVEDFSSYFQDASVDLPPRTTAGLPRADDPFASDNQHLQPETAPAKQDSVKDRTPWDDLEDLIGYDNNGKDAAGNSASSSYDSGLAADGIPAAYMVKKKPRRNYAALVLALLGILLLAGGGYALWVNRDAMNDMVGGLVQSAQPETASTEGTTTPETPAQTPATPPVATNETPDSAPVDDGSVTGTKFTQRLLADGTEKDEGPGPGPNGQPVTAEGQSVYEQNQAPPAAADAGTTAPATPGAAAPNAAAEQTPAAAVAGAQRMFLYEEVLGQTVPTAVEGSVVWTLQNENDAEGRPSPTVQGQISVPGRGLSALITFKRNTDQSLPASHLVEIVFSVTGAFEGGAIDSVQRIAMKRTEQDRGNALIAVPAKITDDFHMIALNDFPDALKTNLELLGTRDWMDIPLSYRNGRRALLTMQKGPEGKSAFETALRDWNANAPAATGQ